MTSVITYDLEWVLRGCEGTEGMDGNGSLNGEGSRTFSWLKARYFQNPNLL